MAPFAAQANEIIVGNGTTSSYNAPFNNFYKNSWNETIYPASSFSSACVINSVAYEVATASPVTMSTLKIYMGETSRSLTQDGVKRASADNINYTNTVVCFFMITFSLDD